MGHFVVDSFFFPSLALFNLFVVHTEIPVHMNLLPSIPKITQYIITFCDCFFLSCAKLAQTGPEKNELVEIWQRKTERIYEIK